MCTLERQEDSVTLGNFTYLTAKYSPLLPRPHFCIKTGWRFDTAADDNEVAICVRLTKFPAAAAALAVCFTQQVRAAGKLREL